MKTKDLESQVLELRGRQYSLPEIVKMTKAESIRQVEEILEREKVQSIEAYKNTDKGSDVYQEVLVHVVKLLRNEYHLNYREIANELGESEYLIFDIIRRNAVSSGKNNNYVKGYFTREEKRMRNEDMIRLNREGKTFSEIGRIFYTSKQNVSQIFKEIGVKPLSEKEALTVGIKLPELSGADLNLKDKNKELQTKLGTTQKQFAMTKYHMNGIIQDLRVKYVTALAKLISNGVADEETIKEYKLTHQAIMRTYNNLVKTDSTDTALFRQLEKVIPLLTRTNVKVR